MNIGRFQNWLNCNLTLPRSDRAIFYALLRAQLRAGVSAMSACETLLGLSDLGKTLRRIAKAGAQAGREGRLVLDGLAETNMFPPADMGVLRIAETGGTLQEALCALEEQTEENLSFVSQVMAPNLYYLVILTVLVGFVWNTQTFLKQVDFIDLSRNPSWRLSGWLHAWWIPLVVGLSGTIAGVWIGKVSWTGPMRRLLLVFDTEARYRFGLEFVRLAELLSRHGASHTEILSAAGSALGHSRYVAHAVRRARRAVHEEGMQWEQALSDGLLLAEHASLLAGLVPGGRRQLYPPAYQALGEIQRRLLKNRYRIMQGFLRTALLLAIAALIVITAEGMYSLFDAVQY